VLIDNFKFSASESLLKLLLHITIGNLEASLISVLCLFTLCFQGFLGTSKMSGNCEKMVAIPPTTNQWPQVHFSLFFSHTQTRLLDEYMTSAILLLSFWKRISPLCCYHTYPRTPPSTGSHFSFPSYFILSNFLTL